MASKKANKNLSPELREKLELVYKNQKKVKESLDNAKKEVTNKMVDSIKMLMGDADFKNNDQFQQYLIDKGYRLQTDPKTPGSTDQQEEWINSLGKDEMIDIIAEYSIDIEIEKGHNAWEEELMKAQERKEATKQAIQIRAKDVIDSYKKLSVEHENLINQTKIKIQEKNKQIQEKRQEMNTIDDQIKDIIATIRGGKGYQPTQAQIDMAKEQKEALEKDKGELNVELGELKDDLRELKGDLKGYKDSRDLYNAEIDRFIKEFEDEMEEDKVHIGRFSKLNNIKGENDSPKSNNTQNYVTNATNAYGIPGGVEQRKAKDIAKAMMVDFANLSQKELTEMIEQTGYGDLLHMTRELGPVNRRKLEKVMENRLEQLGKDLSIEVKDKDGNTRKITIPLDELTNFYKMDDTNFDKLDTLINYYVNNYEKLSVGERKIAEEAMNYLKIGTLLTESKQGKIKRFIGEFTRRGTKINEFGNSLRRFADKKGKREEKKWKKDQDLRTRLGVKTEISSTTRKKHIDRSGKKALEKGMEIGD